MGTSIFCRKHRLKSRLSIKWYHVYAASTSAIEHVYRATCIIFSTKCQSTMVQSISSSSNAGPGVPSDQRTCPQTKLWTSSAVASSSTRGTSPLTPIHPLGHAPCCVSHGLLIVRHSHRPRSWCALSQTRQHRSRARPPLPRFLPAVPSCPQDDG